MVQTFLVASSFSKENFQELKRGERGGVIVIRIAFIEVAADSDASPALVHHAVGTKLGLVDDRYKQALLAVVVGYAQMREGAFGISYS